MASNTGVYRCKYEFVAESRKELTIYPSDIIKVTQRMNNDWLYGITTKNSGFFPVTYVENLFDTIPDRIGVAVNKFVAEQHGDLHLEVGDVVGITESVDENWYQGYTRDKQGIFPSTYIKEIYFKDNKRNIDNNENELFPYGVANQTFLAQDNDEITIREGENIKLIREIDSFWIEGFVNGEQGKFPKSYIKVIVDLPDDLKAKHDSDQNTSSESEPHAKARYMFVGSKSEELSFDKGEIISLIERINRDWYKGQIGNSIGLFPSNHVEVIIDLPFKDQHFERQKSVEEHNNNRIIQDRNSVKPNQQSIISPNHSPRKPSKPKSPPPFNSTPQKSQALNIENKKKKTLNRHHSATSKHNNLINGSTSREQILQNSNNQKEPSKVRKSFSFTKKDKIHKPHITAKPEFLKSKDKKKKSTLSKEYQFELTDEKLFDMEYTSPRKDTIQSNVEEAHSSKEAEPLNSASITPQPKPRKRKPKTQSKKQDSANIDLLHQSPPRTNGTKLPKPLAPMPVTDSNKPEISSPDTGKPQQRPTSLDISKSYTVNSSNSLSILSQPDSITVTSPKANMNTDTLTVSFSKQAVKYSNSDTNLERNTTFQNPNDEQKNPISRSETDPSLFIVGTGTPTTPERSLYFNSTQTSSSNSSSDKRKKTLDAVLQRSASQRGSKGGIGRQSKIFEGVTPSEALSKPAITCSNPTIETLQQGSVGSNESISQTAHHIELKRVESEIVEMKSKLEGEAHLLAGVETLLDVVSDDKRSDLIARKEEHNANIVEMNNDLNALEDEKSYLLASFGKKEDVKNRVDELNRQIDMYLDNCEQLRLMQDISLAEDLPEIRDSIEFCENMVDTLQSELTGLKKKLGELDHSDGTTITSNAEQEKQKRREKQRKVIEELVATEKSYVENISLVTEKIIPYLQNLQNPDIDIKILFGNLSDIVTLSRKLLEELEGASKTISDGELEVLSLIAEAFINMSIDMKECYAVYCRNYDDAQVLLEKYEEDAVISMQLNESVREISQTADAFGLASLLIKPVQRVLKYPLLLSELVKNQIEEDVCKEKLVKAFNTVTDVATAINEFKRRKDLVLKYRETEDGIGKKVQKLNWHSVAKKTNRINQRITQFTGLNTQTVDAKFSDEEKRFKSLEKLIKILLKNLAQFMEEFKEGVTLERLSAESLLSFTEEQETKDEVVQYHSTILTITEVYASELIGFLHQHVNEPLNQLLQSFQGPFRLIQKRNDKCLDYDRAKNKAAKAKDVKDRDRIKQTQDELQIAENVYVALNTQLLEELPNLSTKCVSFIQYCMSNFVDAYKQYFRKAVTLFHELWKLPFFVKTSNLFEIHEELIQNATLQISKLAFVPMFSSASLKEQNRRSFQQAQFNNFTNFFVDFGHGPTSPTDSKPLIDLSPDEMEGIDTVDSARKVKQSVNLMDQELEAPVLQPIAVGSNGIQQPNNFCVLKFDFIAEDDTELTADEGVIVTVIRKSDKTGNSDWWLVEYDSKRGYIPASFLEEIGSSNAVGEKLSTINNSNEETPRKSSFQDSLSNNPKLSSNKNPNSDSDLDGNLNRDFTEYYGLEYDFEALNQGELSLAEGQIVKIIRKHDSKGNTEWWLVEHDGKQGYVPNNYLLFVDKVPLEES